MANFRMPYSQQTFVVVPERPVAMAPTNGVAPQTFHVERTRPGVDMAAVLDNKSLNDTCLSAGINKLAALRVRIRKEDIDEAAIASSCGRS
jgi:hypothetical protein